MTKEYVIFRNTRPYLNMNLDELQKRFILCVLGKNEALVDATPLVREELDALPSEYYTPRMEDIIKYLEATGVEYEIENLRHTTKL